MTEPEQRLRSALHAAAERSTATPPSAKHLLRTYRHHVHRRNAALGASLAAVGVAAWGASDLVAANGPRNGDAVRIRLAGTPSPSAQPAINPACDGETFGAGAVPASPMQHPTAASVRERDALARISLPDPAPGFPTVRGDDTIMNGFGGGRFAWTRTILLAVNPGTTTTLAPGVMDTEPNGQEATVLVACHGAFPTTTDDVKAQHEYAVIGTTTARGQIATIVRSDTHQIGVLLTYDGFDIGAYGDYTSVPNDPVTPDELVTLIDALQHLEG